MAHICPRQPDERSKCRSSIILVRLRVRRILSSSTRPSFCHRFICQKPETVRLSFGTFNVSDDDTHLLKVANGLRWTKRFVIQAQFIKNLDGSHTATTEEIGSPRKEILAALQVKARLVFPWNRLLTGISNRTE
jgi:hypothetical protein